MESILTSIKKLLGIAEDYTHFDNDIIIGINTALSVLSQLGVGPEGGFSIEDDSATWSDFLSGDNEKLLSMVKTYVHFKTKLIFDPPTSSSAMESINNTISEIEWRIIVATEEMRSKNE